jgi:hypothetical protein
MAHVVSDATLPAGIIPLVQRAGGRVKCPCPIAAVLALLTVAGMPVSDR